MRLLFLSTEFPPGPGGIGTHASQLALQLTRRDWQVVVVTPQAWADRAEVEAFNSAQPFEVVRLPGIPGRPIRILHRILTARRWMDRQHPHLVLASGDPAVYLAAVTAPRKRLPWVAVEHGRTPSRWERPIKRSSFGAATAVVAVSGFSLGRLKAMGVRPRNSRVIPNGADAGRFRPLPGPEMEAAKERLGLADARILLTVGNVTERKGQDIVIRALPRILEKAPDTHYVIAGLPTCEPDFRALAERLGVAEHTHFLGRVDRDRLLELYNCCDVFVMTSRHTAQEFEGYGIAVVEAALCSKPAVVTGDSGLAEAIADGETGTAVPIDDPDATAAAIAALLEDGNARRQAGKSARRRALAQQTWHRRAEQYDRLLRSLVT